MNIVLFSKICAKSGVGAHMRLLAEELVQMGHSVWCVSSTNEQGIKEHDNLHVVLGDFQTKNPLNMMRNLKKLRELIVKNKIDVVHCHHRVAALYMKAYRMFWRTPVVYTLHITPVPHDWLHRRLTYVGEMGIGVSSEVCEFMHSKLRIPSHKISLVLNGVTPPPQFVDIKEIKKKYSIPSERYILTQNSRISPIKNQLRMVEAIHLLPTDVKDKIVVLFMGERGGDYYNKVEQQIREYELEEQFIFTGWCDSYEVLAVSDYVLLPSYSEGFALSMAEAFLMKVPAASTATGGWEDMKDVCSRIYPDSSEDICNIITRLVHQGKDSFHEQIEKAYRFATSNLTAKQMALNTVRIYQQVTK